MTVIRPKLDRAACRGREDLYLNPRRGGCIGEMRKICGTCWDRPECLAYALEHEENGFWGGHTSTERAALRTEYGIELDRILVGDYTRGTVDNQGADEDEYDRNEAVDRA